MVWMWLDYRGGVWQLSLDHWVVGRTIQILRQSLGREKSSSKCLLCRVFQGFSLPQFLLNIYTKLLDRSSVSTWLTNITMLTILICKSTPWVNQVMLSRYFPVFERVCGPDWGEQALSQWQRLNEFWVPLNCRFWKGLHSHSQQFAVWKSFWTHSS